MLNNNRGVRVRARRERGAQRVLIFILYRASRTVCRVSIHGVAPRALLLEAGSTSIAPAPRALLLEARSTFIKT